MYSPIHENTTTDSRGNGILHNRNIIHNLLSSTHITLTCRICITLATLQCYTHHPQRSRTFYPLDLTLLPPEYIREMHVVCCTQSRTVQDVGERQRGVWLGNESVVETLRIFRARVWMLRGRERGPQYY